MIWIELFGIILVTRNFKLADIFKKKGDGAWHRRLDAVSVKSTREKRYSLF